MRLLASLIALSAGVACGSPSGPTGTPAAGISNFDNDLMSFEYPANWNALVPESGESALVLLSTEQLAQTEPRIESLGPDGVYIAWTEKPAALVATPKPSLSSEVEVGGRPAVVVQTSADGDCESIDGDQLVLVTVDMPSPSMDVRMQGCTRGPNFELTSATIAGMLASVEWKD
jgi:hypothetical protein